jgi:hypothetical protein
LNSEVEVLEELLAEEFIWVHNHASQIDGKEEALSRAKKIRAGQQDDTRNRSPRDQKVVLLGQTAVVSGFTVVDRGPQPTNYHFMRTYALLEGKWKLLLTYDGLVSARYASSNPRDEKRPQLFDLLADPHENKNLAAQNPAVVAALAAQLDAWWRPEGRTAQTIWRD